MRADSLLKQTLYSACKSDTEGEMCRPVADMSGRLFFCFCTIPTDDSDKKPNFFFFFYTSSFSIWNILKLIFTIYFFHLSTEVVDNNKTWQKQMKVQKSNDFVFIMNFTNMKFIVVVGGKKLHLHKSNTNYL